MTHTRTHVHTTPANPFLRCGTCGQKIEHFHDSETCGCESGHAFLPCEHKGDYDDLCPSWSPVDGCTCPGGHR
ncbi:MAG TPA: hypothetical protein VGG50_11545 [Streptosporangiaceae bacterium]|jgi:hypothetical protein